MVVVVVAVVTLLVAAVVLPDGIDEALRRSGRPNELSLHRRDRS